MIGILSTAEADHESTMQIQNLNEFRRSKTNAPQTSCHRGSEHAAVRRAILLLTTNNETHGIARFHLATAWLEVYSLLCKVFGGTRFE